ncbi:hypothetical protein GCK72_024027 [Caenorhabditis remanei]|uniref:Uncharacterized protein n=1 Tax=Caenorhabditis remanei TaxID=31234 RepID=A0A6A5FYL4_CAERE|nr:hypothetical protein GCK72_024027 [Caenorhabditis remanei]KAF1747562.1 hypothetical protein GCK72_024027 [Caenorhabditis remanei]
MMSWLGGGDLEWNVSVLLPWVLQLLALEHVQVLAHLLSGLRWDNDVVNESSDSSWEGVAEQLGVLLLVLDGVLLIVTEKDGDSSLGSHDSNLSKSGNVDQSDEWNVEGITEANEASSLHRRVDVETSSSKLRVVSNDSDGTSVHSCETNDQILGVVWHDFEEVSLIDKSVDDVFHVVGSSRFQWNNSVQGWDSSIPWVLSSTDWSSVSVGKWKIVEELSEAHECIDVVVECSVSNSRGDSVSLGSSELFLSDFFVGDGLDNIRSSDEQVAGVANHESEVSESRRVDGTSGTWSHDHRDLWDNSRSENVLLEDVGISGKRLNSLLNTGTTRVVESDDWSPDEHSLSHDFDDLLGMN